MSGIVTGVGPYADQVMTDLQQTFSPDTGHGISDALRTEIDALTAKGYSLGVYDFTEGTHASGSAHYTGNAVDVDTLNGATVGNQATTQQEEQFATDALANPHVQVGAFGSLLNWLQQQGYGSRVFADTAGHIHIQTSGDSSSAAPDPSQSSGDNVTLGIGQHSVPAPPPSSGSSWFGLPIGAINDWITNAGFMAFFIALLGGAFVLIAAAAQSTPQVQQAERAAVLAA